MQLQIPRYTLYTSMFILYAFSISFILLPLYDNGDQQFYIAYYNALNNMSFFEGYFAQRDYLGSQEPGYFLTLFILQKIPFISKIFIVAALNTILAYLIAKWLTKFKVSIFIWMLIALNFYLIVLFFSSERLKLALIFFLLSFSIKKYRLVFILISLFTHLQIVFLLFSEIFLNFFKGLNMLIFNQKLTREMLLFIGSLFIFFIIFIILHQHILQKLPYYLSQPNKVMDILKILILILIVLYYNQDKKTEIVIIFLPLFISVIILGGNRLIIFGYFIFMYYLLQINQGKNVGLITVSLFFAFKGIVAIYNIVQYHDIFYIL